MKNNHSIQFNNLAETVVVKSLIQKLAESKKRLKDEDKVVVKKIEKNEKNQKEKKKREVLNDLMDKGYKRLRQVKIQKRVDSEGS